YNFAIAQTDGWLTAGTALALLGYLRRREHAGFPWMLWLGTALAVFAKGPVGIVIVALAVAADLLIAAAIESDGWRRLPREIARLAPIRGMIIALAPLAAWYLAC